ncbi:hypothetical protein EAH89_09665 [Roseomonas nepalensis]|uniref:DUF3300 domain-containing protein n=1 Tax=Muricoccus nepalensis TaxID=1854500 RepID=A0A502G8K5_9PROT|nr:hypothetical protein [Roseomonas nepalensis]TPG57690.1 hypothetical protein EAH89_09665 [Roseomonas nepalensis]
MIRRLPRTVLLLGTLALPACAGLAPPESAPSPLVAYPGLGKTAEAVQGDDAACQQQASDPAAAPPPSQPAVEHAPAAGAVQAPVAGDAYLRCMAARGNIIGPAYAVPVAGYPVYYPGYVYGALYPGLRAYPYVAYRYRHGFRGWAGPRHGGPFAHRFGGTRGGFSHRGGRH